MTKTRALDVAVVGGGSFGTALAHVMASRGHRVELVVRRPQQAQEINTTHTNRQYMGERQLDRRVKAGVDIGSAVQRAPVVLMAVPSAAFRQVARQVGEYLHGEQVLVHAVKGLEVETHQRMSEIVRQETCALKLGVLSGPNLSAELMQGHPSGALVASRYTEVLERMQALYAGSHLRLYSSNDVVGTEIGGAFKNIIALAGGMADGLGMGTNTKALLMTRGLSEMARFGVEHGAQVVTFGGLAGIGDLIATCSSPLSRNYRVGRALAEGHSLTTVLHELGQVAEGVPTAKVVYQQGAHLELPIAHTVYRILYERLAVNVALQELMALPVGREEAAWHIH